jgi:TetR/AcrR family transcriptional regulator, mexCD-oprJ operon repressor
LDTIVKILDAQVRLWLVTTNLHADRAAESILEAASSVFLEKGQAASMSDVAERADVSRATLYNHFANREELVAALVRAAVDAAHQRLVDADLDSVPVLEAVARVSRALAASGAKFAMFMGEPGVVDKQDIEERIIGPLRALFARGLADGTFDPTFSVDVLTSLYGGLLYGALRVTSPNGFGVESAGAAVTQMLLRGATAQPNV